MEAQVKIESKPGCVAAALHILGDKWTALLLKELVDGERTFSELEMAMEGISPRTLSQRLEKLLAEQIIDKVMYCEHPPRFNYKLTRKGAELEAILRAMAEWGERHHSTADC